MHGFTTEHSVSGVNCDEHILLCIDRDPFFYWDCMNPTQTADAHLAQLKQVPSKFY